LLSCPQLTPVSQLTGSNYETAEIIPPIFPSQESGVKTWYHDCSNTTGFEYTEIPTDTWTPSWTYTIAEMQSDGRSFAMPSITNTSPADYRYGPIYTYSLPDVFPLAGLRNISVRMELDNSNPEYCGAVYVGLLDGLYTPVILAKLEDWDRMDPTVGCKWNYYIRNRSIHTDTLHNNMADYYEMGINRGFVEFVNITWSSWFDSEHGLRVHIPAYGIDSAPLSGSIVPLNEVETARDITYLAIMFGRYNGSLYQPPSPFRVHDIFIEYELGGVIDTSPPLLLPHNDLIYEFGQIGNAIRWQCSDDHPYRYWLFETEYFPLSSSNQQEGFWNGTPFIQSVDGFPIGNRSFLLVLQDKAGFIVWDQVTVTVMPNPRIQVIQAIVSFFGLNQLIFSVAVIAIACFLVYYRNHIRSRNSENESQP
jgi:hypothetical protein